MNFTGLIIALISFLCIGLFHPIVIKFEYYYGCQKWPVLPFSALPLRWHPCSCRMPLYHPCLV